MAYKSMPKGADGTPAGRPYRSDLRRQQAEQTRLQVVAAAAELFAQEGYARTTLAKIAAAAGVSVETVQTHGPKAALMIAAVEYVTFEAIGDRDLLESDIGGRFLAIDDLDVAVDYFVDVQVGLHERSAQIAVALYGGAAADRELDQYLNDLTAGIGRQVRRMLTVCRDRGWLRDDLPFEETAETAAVLTGPETYLRMVHRDGWTVAAYRAWLRRMMAEVVLRRAPDAT